MRPLLDILRALVDAEVEFVVVGGVAVVLRGHPRMTVDLDLVLDLDDDGNVERAVSALSGLGLVPRLPVPPGAFADAGTRASWVAERNLTVFSMHDPSDPRREVDLFADAPLDWPRLLANSDPMDVGGIAVHVASIHDLIEMKVAAGRAQDLADVEALRAIVADDDD